MNYRTSLYASVAVSRALRHRRARREERLRLHLTCRGAAEPRGAAPPEERPHRGAACPDPVTKGLNWVSNTSRLDLHYRPSGFYIRSLP